jgi:carbon monoxide dehydrogenase subunit G
MIETTQSLLIEAPVAKVWDYVQDMRRWANLLPGCRECIVEDAHNSRWILKVGAGGLVRTVNVLVHVDHWAGPERVDFSYKLEGDPVEGSGAYIATAKSPTETLITMHVRVKGSGPVAPMWEAMSRPLLPRIAKSFATQLKEEIEKPASSAANAAADADEPTRRTLTQKLRELLPSRTKD